MANRHPDELSTAEAERLLGEIHGMGCPLVVVTGGDPAKRDDLVHLIRFGTQLGLRMALTPSATPLVTAELLKHLADAGLARLAVSLDGATAAVHDSFRGVSGSHARTFEILEQSRALGLTTQINTTVTRLNRATLKEIASQIAPLGIELWGVFLVVPTGRATESQVLDADEVESVLEELADLSETSPFDIKTTAAPHFRRVLLQRKVKRNEIAGIADGIGRAPRGVNDGQGIAFVSHCGDIYPSGFMPIKCGNVRVEGLTATYREHALFRSLRDADVLAGKCGVCEFRRVCGGSRARAYAMTGNPLGEEPACAYEPRRSPRQPLDASPQNRKRLVVIGAGISGLSAAYAALKASPDSDVTLLEASARSGGLIESEHAEHGLLVEHGPDGLLASKPEAVDAASSFGLELIEGGPAPRRAFALMDHRMTPLPARLGSWSAHAILELMNSPLLSWAGKARIAMEPYAPRARERSDESVRMFFERRFGAELLERAIEPLLRGIYGAPTDQLSMRAIFPRLCALEEEYGSIALGLTRQPAAAQTTGATIVSLRDGMSSLPDAYAAALGERLRTDTPVRSLHRTPGGRWRIALKRGGSVDADSVVVAAPPWIAARMVAPASADLAHELSAVRASDLAVATFAWRRDQVPHKLDGTGWVTVSTEPSAIAACTWSSRKWTDRADDGVELFRCFMREPFGDPTDLGAAARRELRELLGVTADPLYSRVRIRRRVLPIYEVGHADRVRRIADLARELPGFALAGNAYGGIGISDCIASGTRAYAQAVAA